jgi:predicted PurR-regulated permease PerM
MKLNDSARLDITHTILSVLFIGLLISVSVWILRPFLMAMVWATLIVVATWPLLLKLDQWLGGRRRLAVTLMTAGALLVLLVPLTLAVVTIVSHAESIPAHIRAFDFSTFSAPPDWLQQVPLAGKRLAARWTAFAALSPEARAEVVAPHARAALQWFAAKAGSVGLILTNVLLAFVCSAVLYAHGEMVRTGILRFARRLAGRHGEEAVVLAAKAARGVVLGVVGTALIQTSLGALALFISGVPVPTLLAALIFLLCLAQLGPILVLAPVFIWLYRSGHPGLGTVVVILTILAQTIDNVIRPFLIRMGVELPLLLIFAGVIGGLIAFGVVGLFIGPVLLAVSYTLLKAWVLDEE